MILPKLFAGVCSAAMLFCTACSGSGGGGNSGALPSASPTPVTTPTPSSQPTPTAIPTTTPEPGSDDGPFIVIDQFGYLLNARKIAVIRDPQQGFDASRSFTPGSTYQLINTDDNTVVFEASPTPWNSGEIHTGSGDKAWWFDFSSYQSPGTYLIRDAERGVDSPEFNISPTVYNEVLKQALRVFFYQRAGFAKEAPFADTGWIDGASHIGPLQDSQAHLYSDADNASTQRDLSGGWYDAGDYNKYTNWTANYVISLLHAYQENPSAWHDDNSIPESGNGIADLLDEVKWGMDWLIRMQNTNGSVLSIVGMSHASPPSSASGASLYGSASTSATLTAAAAFALGAKIFNIDNNTELQTYATDLRSRAQSAWEWADANPNIVFRNNDVSSGTQGLGAGQQEVDDNSRTMKKLEAAVYLFEITGTPAFQIYFDNHYNEALIIKSGYASPFDTNVTHSLLYYTNLTNATPNVSEDIRQKYIAAINGGNVWQAIDNEVDPYLAHLQDYTWGSSSIKANKGFIFYMQLMNNLGVQSDSDIDNASQHYLHYLHGVNPLGKVYLSNMGSYGAENSVDQFYHSWFTHGSANWDSVTQSVYGPPPGFVVGGANPFYNWDNCCPNSCGDPSANQRCGTAQLAPPFNQPAQKSYLDFNDSWPLNSWSVTENSNGYQTNYLRLLSKYVQ